MSSASQPNSDAFVPHLLTNSSLRISPISCNSSPELLVPVVPNHRIQFLSSNEICACRIYSDCAPPLESHFTVWTSAIELRNNRWQSLLIHLNNFTTVGTDYYRWSL